MQETWSPLDSNTKFLGHSTGTCRSTLLSSYRDSDLLNYNVKLCLKYQELTHSSSSLDLFLRRLVGRIVALAP